MPPSPLPEAVPATAVQSLAARGGASERARLQPRLAERLAGAGEVEHGRAAGMIDPDRGPDHGTIVHRENPGTETGPKRNRNWTEMSPKLWLLLFSFIDCCVVALGQQLTQSVL